MMIKQASKEIGSRRRSFNTESMHTFLNWITDARNYEPSTHMRTRFRQKKLRHSYDDIADYINSIHGTKWNRVTVGYKLQWLKRSYSQAREMLTSAGEGGNMETDTLLRDKVLTVCPLFEKLDTVFGTPVEGLHIPPAQTLPPHPGEPSNSRALLSPDTADIDDITESDHDSHPSESRWTCTR
jgi:hypothetical protein